jgi:xylonate dehydratase
MIRVDLGQGTCNMLVDDAVLTLRRTEPTPPIPQSATPWEELYREKTGQLSDGATLDFALKYRRTAKVTPRHNH